MLDDKFIAVLRRHLRFLYPADELEPDVPLRELGLDSMDIVALVLELESELGVQLPQSSLTPQAFASAASLWTEIARSRNRGTE